MTFRKSVTFDLKNEPDNNWDKRIRSSQFGTIFQTKEYGEYEEFIQKSKPYYGIFWDEDKNEVGQILLFETPKGKKKIPKFIPRGLVRKILKRFTWMYGPVVFNDKYSDLIYAELYKQLAEGKEFEGSLHPLLAKKILSQDKWNELNQNRGTFVIDLNQELSDILKKTDKKSVQKNIERSQERGVTVLEFKEINDPNFILYSNLLNKFKEANNWQYSKEQIERVFKLATYENGAGFLAKYEGEPIGGIFISAFNGYINEWGIARDEIDTENKLYAQDLLRWKIIEWGKKNGCKYYDLSGFKSPIEGQDGKEQGIYRNKKKWGGTEIVNSIIKN